MSHIFVYTPDRLPKRSDGDLVCAALTEDGVIVASHVCRSPDNARNDMGLTSTHKHDRYARHYPEGWKLVDMIEKTEDELAADAAFAQAYARLHHNLLETYGQ